MATTDWKACSSFEGYYSSTSWLSNKNCYCDPIWIYGYLPTSVGKTTGRTVEIDVPLLYSKSITSSYEGWLYINGSYQAYTSGSVSLNASDTWQRFTFYNVTADSGAYYSVKLDFGYGTVQCWTSGGKWPEARVTYTAVTSCNAPTSVWGSSNRVIPGQSYTFSWSGASSGVSNSINGYDIAYKYSGDSDWIYPSDVTSTSYEFIPSDHRGQTLQFAVRAKGSYSSSSDTYWSSWAYSENYTINTQPTTPTYGSSTTIYVPSEGASRIFTLHSSDAQGDSLKYFRKTNNSAWFECGSPFTYSFKSVTEETKSIFYFKANDGFEDSESASVTVIQCEPITITSVGLNATSLKTGTSVPYYYQINVAPIYSGGTLATSAVLSIYSGDSSTDINTLVNKYNGSIKNLKLTNLSGKFVKVVLTVSTSLESVTKESDVFYVPEAPTRASSVDGVWNNSIGTDVGSTGKDSNGTPGKNSIFYFGRYLYVKWTVPNIEDTQVALKSMDVVFTANGVQAVTTVPYKVGQNTYTATVDGDIFNAGDQSTLSIVSNDGYQTATYNYSTNYGFKRAANPEIKLDIVGDLTSAFNMNGSSGDGAYPETIYRPHSGMIGAKADNSGGQKGQMKIEHNDVNFTLNGITWIITTTINNQTITLLEERRVEKSASNTTVKTDNSGTFFTHTIDMADWQALFLKGSLAKINQLYEGITVFLRAKDDFGNMSDEVTAKITVDYREVPTWNDNNTALVQKIVYGTKLIGKSLTNDPTNSNKDYYLANKDEKIQLSWSTNSGITDLNDEDDNLKVYVERKTGTIASDGTITFGDYSNINIGAGSELSAGLYKTGSVEYTVPYVAVETPQKFRIYVANSNGLPSDYIETETYTIACRTDLPVISIAKVEDKAQNGNLTITPIISNLGADEVLKDNDNRYTSYERNITINDKTYVRQALFSIEFSQEGTFSNKSTESVTPELYPKNSAGAIVNKYYSSLSGSELSSISTGLVATNLFLRCKLTFRSGFKSLIDGTVTYTEQTSEYSPTYIFYAEAPTVSHRRYKVGINTNNVLDSEALAVVAVKDGSASHNLIRLEGRHVFTEEDSQTTTLTINLADLTLIGKSDGGAETGAINFLDTSVSHTGSPSIDNFTIDGGTW